MTRTVDSLRRQRNHLRARSAEKATVEKLLSDAQQPLRLPSIDEISTLAFELDKRLQQNPEAGRAQSRSSPRSSSGSSLVRFGLARLLPRRR